MEEYTLNKLLKSLSMGELKENIRYWSVVCAGSNLLKERILAWEARSLTAYFFDPHCSNFYRARFMPFFVLPGVLKRRLRVLFSYAHSK
jgi:hypothetical protein